MYTIPKSVKHISFDMWNTLIASNPEYVNARTRYLSTEYNLDPEFAKLGYTFTKHAIDDNFHHVPNVITSHEMLAKVLLIEKDFDIKKSMDAFDTFFEQHPPIVLQETLDMLHNLVDKGYTISITSNTNFISGNILQRVLVDRWGVPFSFTLYSDLLSVGKPSAEMFDRVIKYADEYHPYIKPHEILHVGDSIECDQHGGCSAGMMTLLIKNPSHLVKLLG